MNKNFRQNKRPSGQETLIIFLIAVFRGRGRQGQGWEEGCPDDWGLVRCQCWRPLPRYIKLLIYYTPTIITPLCRRSQKVYSGTISEVNLQVFLSDTDIFMLNYVSSLMKDRDTYLPLLSFFQSPDRPLENVGARVLDTNSTFFWFEHLPGRGRGSVISV